MDKESLEALEEAIRKVHGCDSRWVESASVNEPYFTGEVQVFQLMGHPTAEKCYAWTSVAGRERRHHAVLHGATVGSASQAVRATIAARERTRVF